MNNILVDLANLMRANLNNLSVWLLNTIIIRFLGVNYRIIIDMSLA